MRVSPQLRFKIDDSFDEASRIEALLHDPVVRADLAKAKEDARSQGRETGDSRTSSLPRATIHRMSRRKKGQKVDGWLILDKPLGLTSTQAVSAVRRIFDAQKAGHGGTLDPLATGILPIALGEATKTVPYVMDGTKTYRFTLKFGEQRTTDDAEGEIIATLRDAAGCGRHRAAAADLHRPHRPGAAAVFCHQGRWRAGL